MKTAVAITLLLFIPGLSTGSTILTERMENTAEIAGTFTVILYGKAGYSDPVTAAFLDLEGDGVELVPRAASWAFTRTAGVGAVEALDMARGFVKDHRDFDEYRLQKILGPKGQLIGVEVRARYDPTVYGVNSDLLWIQYWTSDGRRVYFTVSGPEREGSGFRNGLPRFGD